MARTFDDLATNLRNGFEPQRYNLADQLCLDLMIRQAQDMVHDDRYSGAPDTLGEIFELFRDDEHRDPSRGFRR